MLLYPGGHIDSDDMNPFAAAKKEVMEETGVINLNKLKINQDEHIPIDIDTHLIDYNERLNLPEHYHFDFRYLFTIDRILDINLDTKELSNYKWIDMDELSNDKNYGKVAIKIKDIIAEKDYI